MNFSNSLGRCSLRVYVCLLYWKANAGVNTLPLLCYCSDKAASLIDWAQLYARAVAIG